MALITSIMLYHEPPPFYQTMVDYLTRYDINTALPASTIVDHISQVQLSWQSQQR